MSSKSILVAALVLSGYLAHADTVTIFGAGTHRCSEWTNLRAGNSTMRYIFENWVVGAFSGAALTTPGRNLLEVNDSQSLNRTPYSGLYIYLIASKWHSSNGWFRHRGC